MCCILLDNVRGDVIYCLAKMLRNEEGIYLCVKNTCLQFVLQLNFIP